MLLAVDPSIRSSGAALFDSKGILCYANRITIAVIKNEDPAMRWRRMAIEILESLPLPDQVTHMVSERPQVYQREGGKTKGDPNELLAMIGVIGALAGFLHHIDVTTYVPHEWKGQTQKHVMGERILSRLTRLEKELVPTYSHDAIDAVGIGLFYLKRLDRVRVYPGATA